MTDGDWLPGGWLPWRGELHYITGYSRGRENGGFRAIIACLNQRIVYADLLTEDPPKCAECVVHHQRRQAELATKPRVGGGWGGWHGAAR
ncbi:hypothetical protein [Amycolatopsis aidingensis]|uniref:hypothetical protein n=1 Tax=Amycolatopsis aidingensis TaxID=2842453 RepID=UPI001C0D01A3|nr:hypothetical protein [Amycolatopsis aidingensis]